MAIELVLRVQESIGLLTSMVVSIGRVHMQATPLAVTNVLVQRIQTLHDFVTTIHVLAQRVLISVTNVFVQRIQTSHDIVTVIHVLVLRVHMAVTNVLVLRVQTSRDIVTVIQAQTSIRPLMLATELLDTVSLSSSVGVCLCTSGDLCANSTISLNPVVAMSATG